MPFKNKASILFWACCIQENMVYHSDVTKACVFPGVDIVRTNLPVPGFTVTSSCERFNNRELVQTQQEFTLKAEKNLLMFEFIIILLSFCLVSVFTAS